MKEEKNSGEGFGIRKKKRRVSWEKEREGRGREVEGMGYAAFQNNHNSKDIKHSCRQGWVHQFAIAVQRKCRLGGGAWKKPPRHGYNF